jgi:glycosyltransferase involved in cell wall biosynthesis
MRIIFSTDSIERGGKERVMAILCVSLMRLGNEIRILAKRAGKHDSYLNEYNIEHKTTVSYNGLIQYKTLLHEFRPDMVVSWDIKTSLFNLLLYRRLNYKFINGSIRHGVRLFKPSHLFRSLLCHLSPYVISNSFAGLKVNNLRPGKKRFVLYNGIETKFRNTLSPEEKYELKQRFIPGYADNPGFVYISVANFVPYKDYFTVTKALSRLRSAFNFYYLIAGGGPMRKEVEEMTRTYGLEKNIILAGKVENVRDYLFAADVMIHSSRGEGISNAILEAMHAGLPVIATNVGGIPETVYPGSSLLFPYKDHEALYRCLLKSKELKESFNPDSESYQNHLAKFSVETMVRRFEEIIDIVTRKER